MYKLNDIKHIDYVRNGLTGEVEVHLIFDDNKEVIIQNEKENNQGR